MAQLLVDWYASAINSPPHTVLLKNKRLKAYSRGVYPVISFILAGLTSIDRTGGQILKEGFHNYYTNNYK